MTSKISQAFELAKKEKRPALLTYTVAGDSSKKQSLEILKSVAQHASICEWGAPFSAPIADGAQIQESITRALKNNINLNDIFKMVKEFKKSKYAKPLILMTYYNLILQYGEINFLKRCKQVGIDGLILTDLPYPLNMPLANKCKKYSVTFVQLLAPTTTDERMKKIIKDSHDMIYLISQLGVTGSKFKNTPKSVIKYYNRVKAKCKNKNLVLGFGITSKNIKQLKEAQGLVVGSELCKNITQSLQKRQNPVTNITKLVKKLKEQII